MKTLRIIKTIHPGIGNDEYQAWYDGDTAFAGNVIVMQHKNEALVLWVRPDCRRQGVATALYDFIAKDRGKPLDPAPTRQKPDQAEFRAAWEARRNQH